MKDAGKSGGHDQTVRRLETFSDIVIAFTLSQLAFTLRLPPRSQDLLTHPSALLIFLISFALVCSIWWLHHRLFSKYFFPDTPSVLLNFAFLASTVYVAYSLLLITTFGDAIAVGAYGVSIGCAYCLLAILLFKGLRDSRLALDDAPRRDGSQLALRVGIFGAGSVLAAVLALSGQSARVTIGAWFATFVVIVVLRVRQRLANRPQEAVGSR